MTFPSLFNSLNKAVDGRAAPDMAFDAGVAAVGAGAATPGLEESILRNSLCISVFDIYLPGADLASPP